MHLINCKTPSIESIIEQTKSLDSLPLFYDRLNEAINNPRSSIEDIGRVISEDQGLTAKLLKLANSPLFGYHTNIDSITWALTLIGTKQLRDLALAVSVMGSFNDNPSNVINLKLFWKHSIACGILSRNIAIYRREVNQESFFVSGMLHDIGIMVMSSTIPEYFKEVQRDIKKSNDIYFKVEHKHLGYDHSAVGSALLAKWNIPLNISEPIAFHHTPNLSSKYPVETATIHLADIICLTMGFNLTYDLLIPPLDNNAWNCLDIPVSQLDTIIKQSESQIEEAFAVLLEGA